MHPIEVPKATVRRITTRPNRPGKPHTVRFKVSCLSPEWADYRNFALTIEPRGGDLWAVTWQGLCLCVDDGWDVEPGSSSRTDDWISGHRFGLEEAIERARRLAPGLVVGTVTVADALARIKAGGARRR